jgi:hypothetical protein
MRFGFGLKTIWTNSDGFASFGILENTCCTVEIEFDGRKIFGELYAGYSDQGQATLRGKLTKHGYRRRSF